MNLKSLMMIALAVAVCVPATAQKKKKGKKKAVPAAVAEPANELKPVDGKTFSYALGVAQGSSLKDYLVRQMGVDSAYVNVAMEGMTAKISEAEAKRLVAYAAGLLIAKVNKRNMPLFNKQATGNADSLYLDEAEFERGLAQMVLGEEPAFKADSAMTLVQAQLNYQQHKYKQTNADWLARNKKQKGVVTLPSGLQYRVLTEGKGLVATDSTEVEVHYEGKLIDGTVFDSSYKRNKPATFRPDQVIKGWREALTMMPEGSVWELYIPAELGYGERGGGESIPGNSTLIFTVENIKVKAGNAGKK